MRLFVSALLTVFSVKFAYLLGVAADSAGPYAVYGFVVLSTFFWAFSIWLFSLLVRAFIEELKL